MARVDFYILAQADERARHMLACKLAEKAWRLDNSVYIHANNRSEAEHLDQLLWTFRDGSFVPHGLLGRNDGTETSPIMIPIWPRKPPLACTRTHRSAGLS